MEFFRRYSEIIFAFVLFAVILILKFPVLSLPYSWDVMNYIIPASQHVFESGFSIFLWEHGNGHPPLYFLLLGFVFKLFGSMPLVAHLTSVIFSFLAVYFTYLTGKHLFNRKVGIIASLLMFFYPTFFSYSGMAYLAIPLTALTIMSLYFFIKKNNILYIIISSCLVLTEERAIMVPSALLFYKIFKNKKFNLKKDFIFLIPLLVFGLWLVSNKLYYGHFVYPLNASLLSFNIIPILFNAIIIMKNFFFDYYKWGLTSFIVLSCFSFKLFKNKIRFIYSFILSLLFFILIFNLNELSVYFSKYFPNINNYFFILKEFSLLFTILFFIFLLSFERFVNFWSNKNFYVFYFVFIFAFFSYIIFIPFPLRYGLPIYPIIFLLFSVSLVKIFKKYSYFLLFIVLVLFVIQWTGDSNLPGFVLESNMEYVDVVKTHQMASHYLEENYPNSTILVSYPQSLELKYPYLGYVNKPLKTISIPPFPGLTSKNFTIYLNPNIYNKTIDLNSVDIAYYSKQQFENKYSRELYEILDKILIKRFELNGKTVEIYKINKGDKYSNYSLPLD